MIPRIAFTRHSLHNFHLKRWLYTEAAASTSSTPTDAPFITPPSLYEPTDYGSSSDPALLYARHRIFATPSLPPPSTTTSPVEKKNVVKPSYPVTHHFDTYEQVTHLQAWGGFSRCQAKVLMEMMQQRMRVNAASLQSDMLANAQMENETYLLHAALSELRQEVELLRQNDKALLQSELTALSREVQTLEQVLNEELEHKRSELELTMNEYRSDIRQDQKDAELRIQELNNRLTVLLGDTTTSIESLKWETIWKGLMGAVIAVMGVSFIGHVLSTQRAKSQSELRKLEMANALKADEGYSFADMETC
ncbi:uncharacterized protein BYT42DRAFT_577028 [Radiomyces spectabilis]|uniref:uncharacterized protein n=1 Tax=Radiomyces spectabilis TaxID=64574 RepID=UPI00221E8458|nr:uncharacterized protein BYT42DRAFT_577028 [Radiomyces spectabilis]KAI8374618.1 hypothetical protein BYT42DRAFT_577028 [Radiomyces spectabilis]